ncbi:MAG: hypothetical protein ACLTC4_07755 [Hungatella hathewayi]
MRKNGFFRNFVGVMVTAVTISQCQSGQLVGAAEIQPETVAVESFEMAEEMGQNAGVNWATPWDADEVEENAGRDEVRDTDQKIATPGDAEIDNDIVDEKDGMEDLERTSLSLAAGDLWEDWNGEMDFPGDGTKEAPYQISTLSQLMGLSQAVAEGTSFAGAYLELEADLDLGSIETNQGNWNPIGWYRNRTELGGKVKTPFRGHFDGAGHTISGLKIINLSDSLGNVGLFGVIDGGSVEHLVVEADDIYGEGDAGVLAGTVTGGSRIYDVTVSGYVNSKGDIGGIAGTILGGTENVVIENCRAEGIVLNGRGSGGFTGGIGGNVQKANLVDNTVITQDGDANRIRGLGYVGGIVGRMNQANLYNSYVSGTIGGNGSLAVGGFAGKYESGNLILARFAGDISRTNQGSAAHEGTFVGTRESRNQFTYGTEKHNHLSYLFTTSGAKARRVFGSNIDGDNTYTKEAHIGYWTDNEKKYVTVAGAAETGCGDRYFYEELESGVRYVVTQKLEREFAGGSYEADLGFRLDHFAPGFQGEPVRGYLVSIPRIDAKNANGTYDTDVATLTAVPVTNSSWYRQIDKDNPAAIAPGETVSVATAPKNRDGNRYQMRYEETEEGKVKPPVYLDETGESISMGYVSGGYYSFEMPACDTELRAEYVKVTTRLSLEPSQMALHVVQTRTGDRKAPSVLTEVKDEKGVLIARYIDGVQDTTVEVQPVAIHATLNSTGASGDRTVMWSVDDKNLLTNLSKEGYTDTDARVIPNLESSFIQNIIRREIEAQVNQGYQNPINNTIYTRSAVVTAATNPETSVDHQPVVGNCRVDVNFQILDYTTLRVEGLRLNKNQISYTVTRKLTGDRKAPVETYTCSEPVVLTANLYPAQPFYKNVSGRIRKNGRILQLTPRGTNTQECEVRAQFDVAGKNNPAWIQNVIYADDAKKAQEGNHVKLEGTAVHTETVTAVSEDQTHGHLASSCEVTLRFVTADETYVRSGSGSSGGSGGSSGGGGGSKGVTPAGNKTSGTPPLGAIVGIWVQTADGKWTFADGGRTYNNEWTYVHNPYAGIGQEQAGWFRFSETGHMVTGWYQDGDGNSYYLNPNSDGTLGRMVTGWQLIDGKWYYFNEISDGKRGALLKNTTTPDGYVVDENGVWNGK